MKKGKLIAAVILLAAVCGLGGLWDQPDNAYAADRANAWDGSVDISWYTEAAEDPSDPEQVKDFYVETPAQLAGLAYIVNGRLDTDQFPLVYQANTEGTGLYKKTVKDGKTYYPIATENGSEKDKPGFTGDTDVDAVKTLEKVVDGSEEDGATKSGLTAEDFWVAEPVYVQLTGGGGGNTWDQIYAGYQKYDFMGQTVHITADLDMGGQYSAATDSWSGPNWTPIGGKYSMDTYSQDNYSLRDVVTIDTSFNGFLDGGGHTISHMYCDRYIRKGFEYSQGVALVGQVGALYDDEDTGYGHAEEAETAPEGWIPGVSGISMGNAGSSDTSFRGYIYGRRMVGGIVGLVGSIPEGILVENCANFATLGSCDSKGIGGIVGSGWGQGVGTIRNCYNAGNVTATYSECPAGGISGANSMNIYNCYNIGQIRAGEGGSEVRSSGIGRHDFSTYTVDNCYSLQGSFQDTSNDGYWTGTSTSVVCNVYVRSREEMKAAAFREEINGCAGSIFVEDTQNINGGFPILFWQAADFDASKRDTTRTISLSPAGEGGSITALVPRTKAGDGYTDEKTLNPGESLQVPYGTVVTLRAEAELPNVLESFLAGGKAMRADYYVVTEDASLNASFVRLKQGTIHFTDGPACHLGFAKDGTALNSFGKAVAVKDYLVKDGDTVFQNDVLRYKAVLKKGASPADTEKEFTGEFDYQFTYPAGTRPEPTNPNNTTNVVNTAKRIHTVSAAISQGSGGDNNALSVSAEPRSGDKTWISQADTSWCDPDDIRGTYTLKTAAQLAGLAKLVNEGESFAGATINLGRNISLKNADGTGANRFWPGIGNSAAHAFAGKFNGKGYAVTDMNAYSSGGTAALFGYCKNAQIRNLTVYGTSRSLGQTAGIAANCDACSLTNCVSYVKVKSSAAKAGGICAEIKNGTALSKCRNKGTVSATASVGGIVGATDATGTSITQCANYAKISGTDTGSGTATGGIAGYLGGLVKGCANFGNVITKNAYAGGIAGHTWANTKAEDSDSSEIRASLNWGKVKNRNTTKNAASGGLVGYGQYLIMSNCYSTGAVSLGYTGKRAHKASLVGYFYKSTFNKIAKTYYSAKGASVICKDVKSASNDGLDVSKQSTKLSYVSVKKRSAKAMQKPAFVKLMNKGCAKTFSRVKKSPPQLVWVKKLKECKVTFKGAYKGTDRTYYNGMVTLPSAPAGYVYTFKAGKKKWTGTNIRRNVTVTVKKTKIKKAYVIYQADGREVARTAFRSADKYLKAAPPDPQGLAPKAGYTASWQEADMRDYWDPGRTAALGTKDIVIHAVYAQRQLNFAPAETEDGRIAMSCTVTAAMAAEDSCWFLKPEARGTLTVEPGVTVTLDGSNGAFTNLQIVVGEGARVTLRDMQLMTDPASLSGTETPSGALQLQGGSDRSRAAVVCIEGYCSVQGTNDGFNMDAGGNPTECKFPAVQVSGYGLIDQSRSASDTLHITAYKDNPEINLLDAATLEIAGGTVEVYRLERLGAQGGMINGTEYSYDTQSATGDRSGNLTVSGGTLIAVSDTNNVFAFCVNEYTQTGGQVICYAAHAETVSSYIDKGSSGLDRAVYATKMSITGGSLRAKSRTHKDNESDPVFEYENENAILVGGNRTWMSDNYTLFALSTADWAADQVHQVTMDGRLIYEGAGPNVGYTLDTGDTFSTRRGDIDQTLYFWIPRDGGTHQIAVDGRPVQ